MTRTTTILPIFSCTNEMYNLNSQTCPSRIKSERIAHYIIFSENIDKNSLNNIYFFLVQAINLDWHIKEHVKR